MHRVVISVSLRMPCVLVAAVSMMCGIGVVAKIRDGSTSPLRSHRSLLESIIISSLVSIRDVVIYGTTLAVMAFRLWICSPTSWLSLETSLRCKLNLREALDGRSWGLMTSVLLHVCVVLILVGLFTLSLGIWTL